MTNFRDRYPGVVSPHLSPVNPNRPRSFRHSHKWLNRLFGPQNAVEFHHWRDGDRVIALPLRVAAGKVMPFSCKCRAKIGRTS